MQQATSVGGILYSNCVFEVCVEITENPPDINMWSHIGMQVWGVYF